MIRFVIIAALLIALVNEARPEGAAPPVPRLKELVTVTADIVRVGDLVENAGAAANVPVFRAPDLGQTGAIQVTRVTDALRLHNLAGLDTGGISEVVVTRLSRAVSAKDIEERIAGALAGQQGLGDARNLAVTFDRDIRSMHVETSVTAELMVARMNMEARTGRFDILFELPGSMAARRAPLRFTGTVTEMVETATLTRPIARGDVLRASDVTIERRPKAEVAGEAVTADQVVGLSAKRALRAAQVLRSADLMKPEIVQRNETVTILYEIPGILLTVRGKALETGALGDLIGVLNVQSNRKVQATVTGPGRVAIVAATPIVAAATAPVSNSERPSTE